jgi:[protein-PII] uridylyltransferase
VSLDPNELTAALQHRDPETDSAAATLAEHRKATEQRLLQGASGAEVVAVRTELVDRVILDLYRSTVRRVREGHDGGVDQCCLVALGGYGRRELAPYSDIDVMFLFRPEAEAAAQSLSREVLHYLWDVGFQVGHSVRTIPDCIRLASGDLTIRTAMMEARFLAGNARLFQEFRQRYFSKVVARSTDWFIDQKIEERRREYEKFGETVYLLEPNVKKSKGGLRDLHVLQWAGMARHQAATLQELADRGILSRQDLLALLDAREFLWRVRALLHVHAGMAQEILSFDEQVWLAERFGFHDQPHLLAVEQFMQQYYRHTMGLHERCIRFVDRCRSIPLRRRLARFWPARRVDGYFLARGSHLTVPAEVRAPVLDSPGLLLRLFLLSQSKGLAIETELLEDIHRHVDTMSGEAFRTPEVGGLFRQLLSRPGPVAATLEAMHRAHVLEKLIPVFSDVRGLMQFNQYHKYTVDEHSLLAVAKAEALAQDEGILGEVYREIRRKDLLHLAVLLHDLGKGREEDHSEVGKAIAEETAARLAFDEQETRTLVFLVHQHLLMAHTAFRRDAYDDKVVLTFARRVATPEVLRKMLVLTAADIAAVGPGMLTKWKESLLIELFLRTLPELSGEKETVAGTERLNRIAGEVAREAAKLSGGAEQFPGDWIREQLAQFPLRYVHGTSPAKIAQHLAALKRLQPADVLVQDEFNDTFGTCEYTVLTFNDLIPGIFSKIAGVMAARGLQILDAQIITRHDGIVVDTFQVMDQDHAGVPPVERRQEIARTITQVLKGGEAIEQLVGRTSRMSSGPRVLSGRQPTEVQVDNETSDRYTIIDVFADDQLGLLYVITRAIFTLGLSVHAARISTRLDQVVDVFYVTDVSGAKVESASRLEAIRATLKEEIDRFLGKTAGRNDVGPSDGLARMDRSNAGIMSTS